ncbi:MAG: thioredoxin [Caldiserica bacterium CG02_land_8_20_14_3_00_36_38]|jgi:thioredoxin 1|nr:thioredoxin [Caldisericota bacterium]NCQ53480.1 thioredoxin [Caldisericota bacterium]OIP14097.1 MAG: thioredoxin [Caldisericum sp. CG2_30_36_11]PIV57185.1 MAG: thioredoxin [Caldiserica bacterium CG02_land_8_20_14_3_00_36_38]PIW10194.1 MAG: thioredoxin [Caldiserica bacterium CG17_big_fil_post_rev_8_21_14_2_50_35_7]
MEVDELDFKEKVLDSPIPVVVDFWAEWCMPCKMIEPIILELEKDYLGKIKIARLNVDENQNLAVEYGIMSIPTLGFFVNGQMVDEITGAVPKRVIEEKIKQYSAKN